MKSGDLIQIQKNIRVQQCGQHSMNRLSDYELFPTLTLQPGEVYLLTDFYIGEEQYPVYNYFEITILAAGQQWTTTVTIDDENEIDDFIQAFESPTLC
tara:strand:+ start:40 stop:333 length:294 start_codon:yes stop_codon:yes gene_type:complete